ncbi:protein SHQ1 homolog [Mytilus galloprovincialis]|uniref:protein SHQ1 homolog n=1 Tax=Mytilus galloprovincialis TaxID=29158 RepID=UPI003F7BE031
MLTPAFEIKQDDTFITIIIKAPYARITDTEIFIEGNEFRFHSKPYFLRLSLPGNIVEDGREQAKYDADNGSFTVTVPKETPGESFEGLDMITKLLTNKGQTTGQSPLIEVLNESTDDRQAEKEEEEEEFDWHIEQTPYNEKELSLDCPKYGFANQKSGVFTRLQDEIVEIVDLKNPDQCSISDRREKREMAEQQKFDKDYYLADLYEDDAVKDLLSYNQCLTESFTDEDKEMMRNLPKKEYLIDNKISTYLGLVDIIFAYCYDVRSTEGEHNVESSWTISKLSSTLSWLDTFTSVEETLRACYRRCLCYPLYRNWEFAVRVHHDTVQILNGGRQTLLKCLLDIHRCFSETYPHYLLNDLYITDYCVWIQSADSKQIQSLTDAIQKLNLKKVDVGLDLSLIESQTKEAMVDHVIESLGKDVSNIKIPHDSDDDSDESSGEYTETDDESTDSECSTNSSDDERDNTKETPNIVVLKSDNENYVEDVECVINNTDKTTKSECKFEENNTERTDEAHTQIISEIK